MAEDKSRSQICARDETPVMPKAGHQDHTYGLGDRRGIWGSSCPRGENKRGTWFTGKEELKCEREAVQLERGQGGGIRSP